jgi:transposase
LRATAGQESDIRHAAGLLADHRPAAVIADKGYDSDAFRAEVAGRGAEAVVPPLACRKAPPEYDRHLYRERNVAERFWSKVKQFRRVATRYEKKARNYLAFVQVAAMMVMLK